MVNHFRRPFRGITVLLLAVVFGFVAAAITFMVYVFIAVICHFNFTPIILFLCFAIYLVVALYIIFHCAIYPLTSSLELTKKRKNVYEINMRTIAFFRNAKLDNRNSLRTAERFIKDFPEAMKLAAERFPSDSVTFKTKTWLIRKKNREYLIQCGFKFKPIHRKSNLLYRGYSRLAFGFDANIKKHISNADFFEVTWNSDNLKKCLHETEKRTNTVK